ncbi:hypothetical protein [Rothia sp. P5766]|uniref:hypothetical protein n=1 Tax=Rothia sp. P5766 TaxID=3402656 RepID=UPI003AE14880
MSFDSHSELPSHLLALAQMTQWYTDAHQLPLELRLRVHEGAVDTVRTSVTGGADRPVPTDYAQAVTVAALDIARSEDFSGSFTVRINSSPGGQVIVKQVPLATADSQPAPAAQPQQIITADGLQLRAALMDRGHTSGYSPQEIANEERERGFSFSPELKFYRALVREGVVAQAQGRDVLASSPQADFGASSLDSAPWKAPATHDGTVQAVLNHRLWIEIAHSDSHLYAIDLAPGSAGVIGQIIARPIGEASVPVQVASSLAQFVVGEVGGDQGAQTPQGTSQNESPFGQTIAWVGTVDPIAFPSLLGWAGFPAESRYRQALQELADPAPAEGETDAETVEQRTAGQAETSGPLEDATPGEAKVAEDASALFSSQAPTEASSPVADTEATAGSATDSGKQAGATSKADEPEYSTNVEGTEADSLKAPSAEWQEEQANGAQPDNEPERAETVQSEASEVSADNTNPGKTYAPISPEQKNIATAIGTLAFGTKEQREEYRAADTSPMPTHDRRGKKLSLTSASPGEVTAQREDKQPEGNLRSALRKFFTGS